MAQMTVAEAALALDAEMPGWHERIDLSILDMHDGTRCVLGQLYGNYDGAPRILLMSDAGSYQEAFDIGPRLAWEAEIKGRRSVAVPAAPLPDTGYTQDLKLIKQLQAAGHPDIADALLIKMLADV